MLIILEEIIVMIITFLFGYSLAKSELNKSYKFLIILFILLFILF